MSQPPCRQQLLCCLLSDVPRPLKHQPPAQEREVNVPAKALAGWGVPLQLRGESRSGTGSRGREGRPNFLLRIQGLAGIGGQALGHLTASQESIETKVFFDLPHS